MTPARFIEDPLRRSFAAKVVGMDDGIGKLLRALQSTRQADNTLVIFMTDHGGDPKYGGSNRPLRGGKATLFEGGLRVPCLVRLPGMIPAGAESDAVVCAIDWYPTFAQWLGIDDVPENLDGESILPVLKGKPFTRQQPIAWTTGSHAQLGRKAWHAVRDGRWKWVSAPGKPAELFDLASDPSESNDVIASHPEIAERLQQFSRQTLN